MLYDTATVKKNNFKQIVANNIHEKFQAVCKTKNQVKVPIVRKLAKVRSSKVATNQSKEQTSAGNSQQKNEANKGSDNDSIGSASDLRTEEDFFDEDLRKTDGQKLNRKKFDDAVSESVKTCGSSAYHAECESVTTNEDNASRVVVRVRMRKKDRLNDSTNTIIDENQLSPSSADFLHQYGDRPLLLDDELELEYNSSDNADVKEDESPEELDVFAMAPFKMPLPKPRKLRPSKNSIDFPNACSSTVVVSNQKMNETPKPSEIWTSTPKKTVNVAPTTAMFNTYLANIPPPPPTVSSAVECDVPPLPHCTDTADRKSIESSSSYGKVTVTSTQPSHFPPVDIFGSVPFPEVIEKSVQLEQMRSMEDANRPNLTVINVNSEMPQRSLHHRSSLQSLVTVNQSIVIDKTLDMTSSNSSRKFINFSHPPPVDHILPIADNEFISNPNYYSQYDEEEEVLATSNKSKKDKVSKYAKDSASLSTSSVRLPTMIASKVKGNPLNYKKVSYKPSKKDTEHPYQNGFSNMSFEDFPSDQELGVSNADNVSSTPFEVMRNDKIMVDVEKKFSSLKRKPNLFS